MPHASLCKRQMRNSAFISLSSHLFGCIKCGWRIARCLQRQSLGRPPTRIRGDDQNEGPLPHALYKQRKRPAGRLVRRSRSPLARRPAPRSKPRDLAPAVVIVRWNIVGLATDFHFRADRKANPPTQGLAPCLSISYLAPKLVH